MPKRAFENHETARRKEPTLRPLAESLDQGVEDKTFPGFPTQPGTKGPPEQDYEFGGEAIGCETNSHQVKQAVRSFQRVPVKERK